MTDAAVNSLAEALCDNDGSALWLADEHHAAILPVIAERRPAVMLLSNRFDIARQATLLNIATVYNDWAIPEISVTEIYLRICKEKPATHHLINQAFTHLPHNGRLIVSGFKDEGIKTYFQKANQLFRNNARLSKHGSLYQGFVVKSAKVAGPPLDTRNYDAIRPVATLCGKPVFSKPGVYGWNKIDQGSAFLVEFLQHMWNECPPTVNSVLDLGCGYGYLSLAMANQSIQRRVATDNNAAATACARFNAHEWGLPIQVVDADCGDAINDWFDLILCNPPFHTGFDVDSALHDRFLQAASVRLSKNGTAFFVVNSFLALEKKAAGYFGKTSLLANNGKFKILQFQN